MKKVLIVMTTLYNGGAERSLVNFLNELPPDKYEIDLLLFKREGMFLAQVPEFVNILETPGNLYRLFAELRNAGRMFLVKAVGNVLSSIFTKGIREKRGFRWNHFYGKHIENLEKEYDVAIAYLSGEVLYYVDEKVKAKKKLVWIHNDYSTANHPRKYEYQHLQNMDGIVSISELCVNILKKEFPEFSDKIYYLPNITSSVVLKKRALEFYPPEYNPKDLNIVSIGRLDEQKGFDMAVHAAEIMKEAGLRFKWYILGSGDMREQLIKQIHSEEVEDCFYLLGIKENPYPYIKNASIFVQSSRYEGKSVVLDEAKILAVPIVVTSYPTVYDQMKDGVEGKIVPISSDEIAKGILELAGNKEEMQQFVDTLRNQDYGNQEEIKGYEKLLDS